VRSPACPFTVGVGLVPRMPCGGAAHAVRRCRVCRASVPPVLCAGALPAPCSCALEPSPGTACAPFLFRGMAHGRQLDVRPTPACNARCSVPC